MTLPRKKLRPKGRTITGRTIKIRPTYLGQTTSTFKDVWGIEELIEAPKKKVIKEEPVKEEPVELDRNDLNNWYEINCAELRRSDFPLCCGLQIINNFPNQISFAHTYGRFKNDFLGGYSDIPKIVLQKFVEKQLKEQMNNVSQGMVIVLNSLQTPLFEEVVLNCGFKKVVEPFLYIGHGRDLTMYFCHPTRGKTLSKSTF